MHIVNTVSSYFSSKHPIICCVVHNGLHKIVVRQGPVFSVALHDLLLVIRSIKYSNISTSSLAINYSAFAISMKLVQFFSYWHCDCF